MSTHPLSGILILPAVFASCQLLAAAPAPAASDPAARKPNFVVFLIDDMGWRDIGANGSRFFKTPNIDRLAAGGMRFTQAYAACAVCSPTRAALLTGKYPARLHLTDWIPGEVPPEGSKFRVPDWTKRLPLEEVTLAEVLKKEGYATASIGKWHLGGSGKDGSFLPQSQGFDVNVAGANVGHPASYFWPYGGQGDKCRVPGLAESGGGDGEYLTDRLTAEAVKFIGNSKDRPFFLYLPHYAVHVPLGGRPDYVKEAESEPVTDAQSNAKYAAMVRSVDDSVGAVMAALKELRLDDNTVVMFTSDNGGLCTPGGKNNPTSNLPLRAGKGFPYEGGIREPLIIRAPGLTKPGSVCPTPVITMDLFPTVAALAGAPAGAACDGENLVPLLGGKGVPAREALYWHYPHYWNGGRLTPYSAIREGDWKLIHWYEHDGWELYNLAEDEGEQNDLASRMPEKVAALRGKLNAWMKSVDAQPPVPR